jgi:hypothetical protein
MALKLECTDHPGLVDSSSLDKKQCVVIDIPVSAPPVGVAMDHKQDHPGTNPDSFVGLGLSPTPSYCFVVCLSTPSRLARLEVRNYGTAFLTVYGLTSRAGIPHLKQWTSLTDQESDSKLHSFYNTQRLSPLCQMAHVMSDWPVLVPKQALLSPLATIDPRHTFQWTFTPEQVHDCKALVLECTPFRRQATSPFADIHADTIGRIGLEWVRGWDA